MRIIHLEQLEFIVEVAKTGSLTQAAKNCHVTLSAVSQSLSNLEAELGVTLFARSRNGATATVEGQAIVDKAVEVLQKLQELKQEAQLFTGIQRGELRMAAIPGPLSLLIHTIIRFKRDYPHIEMVMTEKSTREIMDDVLHHRADIGLIILYEDMLSKHGSLSFGKLLEGRMVVGVSKQSPLALRKSITPQQLMQLPIVLYKDDYLKFFIEQMEQDYGPFQIIFHTNNLVAIQKSVADNLAVTVGLDFSFNTQSQDSEIILLQLDMPGNQPFQLGWISSNESMLPAASQLFIKWLNHELQES
ncbi:LysR family transcriptional regulator [Paenibacillus radicis (ex Gao et al. 2016)]|uniref:LysR family transcriptional regulator n=1 Tax=Paenibacillus radicis (ex Gao et al. 2016) TaxID=1737354 RepID=A0A917H4B8_9BACL|nr:LysR family transcriptional regulator [Paenibacillus radicis (ex Gao et al. 2016)]